MPVSGAANRNTVSRKHCCASQGDAMDTELMLDVCQANEFKLACRRAGYTNADIKRMCEGDTLTRLLPVLRGSGEVQIVKHLIDLDADPFVPEGWSVESHQKAGTFEWDPTKVRFHLDERQKDGKWIEGYKLLKKLATEPVFNANLLDYLLKNPHLIPEEWKTCADGKTTRYTFFWGTVYRGRSATLCVRYLLFSRKQWYWSNRWLGNAWDGYNSAAVLAS